MINHPGHSKNSQLPPQLHNILQSIKKSFMNDREKFEELSHEELKILKQKARQETEELRQNTLCFFYPQTNPYTITKQTMIDYKNCQHLYKTRIKPSYNQQYPSGNNVLGGLFIVVYYCALQRHIATQELENSQRKGEQTIKTHKQYTTEIMNILQQKSQYFDYSFDKQNSLQETIIYQTILQALTGGDKAQEKLYEGFIKKILHNGVIGLRMKDLSSEATKLFKHTKYLDNLTHHRTSSDSIGVRIAFYEEDVAHASIQGLKGLIEQQPHITINKENIRGIGGERKVDNYHSSDNISPSCNITLNIKHNNNSEHQGSLIEFQFVMAPQVIYTQHIQNMIHYGILETIHNNKHNNLKLSIAKGKQYDFWKYCLTYINDIEHKPYKDQIIREFIYANVPNTTLEKRGNNHASIHEYMYYRTEKARQESLKILKEQIGNQKNSEFMYKKIYNKSNGKTGTVTINGLDQTKKEEFFHAYYDVMKEKYQNHTSESYQWMQKTVAGIEEILKKSQKSIFTLLEENSNRKKRNTY